MIRVGAAYPQALWEPLTLLRPFLLRIKNPSKKKKKTAGRKTPVSAWETGPSSEKENRRVRRRGVRWCRRRLHAFLRLSPCPDNVSAFPCAHLVAPRRGSRGAGCCRKTGDKWSSKNNNNNNDKSTISLNSSRKRQKNVRSAGMKSQGALSHPSLLLVPP